MFSLFAEKSFSVWRMNLTVLAGFATTGVWLSFLQDDANAATKKIKIAKVVWAFMLTVLFDFLT